MKKLAKDVVEFALQLGFTFRPTKAGHYRFDKAGTKPVFISGTTSDHRAIKNMKSDLRRAAANCG